MQQPAAAIVEQLAGEDDMSKVMRVEIRCYSYECPDCGAGDQELGHLAADDELHCVVCLIDEDRYVRLRRWLADPAPAMP